MTYSDDIKRLNIFSFYESLATEILNHILELGLVIDRSLNLNRNRKHRNFGQSEPKPKPKVRAYRNRNRKFPITSQASSAMLKKLDYFFVKQILLNFQLQILGHYFLKILNFFKRKLIFYSVGWNLLLPWFSNNLLNIVKL